VGWSLKRTGRLMLIYAALLIGLGWAFVRLPGGFLPVDERLASRDDSRAVDGGGACGASAS